MKKMRKSFFIFLASLLILNFLLLSVAAITIDDEPKSQIIISLSSFLNLGESIKQIIISLVILAIIFAGIYDILELVSIFQNRWVKLVIAGGLGVIAALVNIVHTISIWAISIAAGLGAAGVVIEIIVAIIIFVGLSIGNSFIAKWAAKRKGQIEEIKAIKGAGKAGAAITALKELQEKFRKGE